MRLPPHVTGLLRPLATVDELDAALSDSAQRLALLFKHSRTCGTSGYALEEVEQWLAGGSPHAAAFIVDVHAGRAVAREIETRLSLRHESPQAILVRDGNVVWSASHYRITADALREAVTRASSSERP